MAPTVGAMFSRFNQTRCDAMTEALSKIDFQAISARESASMRFREECYRRVIDDGAKPLLSRATSNTKTRKSMRIDYRIVSLALAHASESGHNVCAQSTKSCRAVCVGSDQVGMAMVYQQVMIGRIRKTEYLFSNRQAFLIQLIGELQREWTISEREGSRLVVRLNCFSDLPWETRAFGMVPQLFRDAVFYDYTKIHSRVMRSPANYHLCGSWSENPKHRNACWELLQQGRNIAVAFGEDGPYSGNRALGQGIPETFRLLGTDYQVYDGDSSDLRFLDDGPDDRGLGRICGLRFKAGTTDGRNEGLASGFVVMQ